MSWLDKGNTYFSVTFTTWINILKINIQAGNVLTLNCFSARHAPHTAETANRYDIMPVGDGFVIITTKKILHNKRHKTCTRIYLSIIAFQNTVCSLLSERPSQLEYSIIVLWRSAYLHALCTQVGSKRAVLKVTFKLETRNHSGHGIAPTHSSRTYT